jgi:hypothetical protein
MEFDGAVCFDIALWVAACIYCYSAEFPYTYVFAVWDKLDLFLGVLIQSNTPLQSVHMVI